jgi:hypothetical protein
MKFRKVISYRSVIEWVWIGMWPLKEIQEATLKFIRFGLSSLVELTMNELWCQNCPNIGWVNLLGTELHRPWLLEVSTKGMKLRNWLKIEGDIRLLMRNWNVRGVEKTLCCMICNGDWEKIREICQKQSCKSINRSKILNELWNNARWIDYLRFIFCDDDAFQNVHWNN